MDLPVTLPADGTAVEIGLRPEHLTLDPKGRTHRIEMTESLGGVSYAYLKGATGEKNCRRGARRNPLNGRGHGGADP